MLIGKIVRWSAATNCGFIEVEPGQGRVSDVPVLARHCRFKPRYGLHVCFGIGEHDGRSTAVRVQLYGESKLEVAPIDNAGLAKTLARRSVLKPAA